MAAILDLGVEIAFALQSFQWSNNASGNAGVTCVVVGFASASQPDADVYSGATPRLVAHISPYLDAGNRHVVYAKQRADLPNLPPMTFGSMPNDGGHLIL